MSQYNWHLKGMALAELVASWSKDPSTKVGAAIFNEQNKVLGVGYNGFPRGIEDNDRLKDREHKYPRILHAEVNAIANSQLAFQEGNHLRLYCTLHPCERCSAQIIQAGVETVITYRLDNDRWMKSAEIAQDMFHEAGVDTVFMIKGGLVENE